MLREHDRIVLNQDIPQAGLQVGDVGTIIHVYQDGVAFEVEFLALDGGTAAISTVLPSQVRPVNPRDITHARQMQRAF